MKKIEADSIALGVTVKVNNIEVVEAENVVPFVRYRLSFESNNKQLLSIVDILNNLPVYAEVQNITSIAIETVEFPILAKHEIIFDIFVRN